MTNAIKSLGNFLGMDAPAPKLIPASSNDIFLNTLGRKILEGGQVTQEEATTLTRLSSTKQSIFARAQAQFGKTNVHVIDSIRLQVQNDSESFRTNQIQIRELLDFQGARSISEQKALANLLLSYHEFRMVPCFRRQAARLTAQYGPNIPLREIHQLIATHNRVSAPQSERAGSVAIVIGNHKLAFNREGLLELTPSDRKSVRPLAEVVNPTLSANQIETLKEVYREVARSPYNNLGPMMEFMRFFRECARLNPDLSLKEAYETFTVSGAYLHEKYQSGGCVTLTCTLRHRFQELGVNAAAIGQFTGPEWAQAPIPNPYGVAGLSWPMYDQQTEDVHHCGTLVPYPDANGDMQVLFFDNFTNETQRTGEDIQAKTLGEFNSTQTKRDTKGDITNVDNVIKMQMAGKTKMVIAGNERTQILGVDLLKGNLYLSSKGAEDLPGLPLNADGRFSIVLDDLKKTLQIATYYVNGEPVEMTHREALDLFCQVAGARFHLPQDFAENMQTLAREQEELFATVLLSPVKTVKVTLVEVENAKRVAVAAKATATEFSRLVRASTTSKDTALMRQYITKNTELANHFTRMQEAIFANQPAEVRRLAATITLLGTELQGIKTMVEQIHKGAKEEINAESQ